MNVTSLFNAETAAGVRVDAPIGSTVRIPPLRRKIVWRLISAVAVVVFSAYALIHQALDYEPRTRPNITFSTQEARDIPADVQEAIETVSFVNRYGREWRMFVTVVALLTGMLAVFRELGRLQSTEPGMIVAPSGVTINAEANRRVVSRIPWSEVKAIVDGRYKGLEGVAFEIRDVERFLDEGSFLKRFFRKSGDARIVLASGSLQIDNNDLKILLTRYFEEYGTVRNESKR